MGKINKILVGQYIHGPTVSVERLSKEVTGSATQAEKEPLIAKTINIKVN